MRECDDYGCGYFGAPRGTRKHNGRDIACYPGTQIFPEIGGKVTKLGHPYSDNPRTEYNEFNFRYVEITDNLGRRWRYFYIKPSVDIGAYVSEDDIIGIAQDLRDVYGDTKNKKAITCHVHLEVIVNGEYMDPLNLV